MENFLNILQTKYNYDSNIIKILRLVIPAIVDYYGEESSADFLEKILNLEIHVRRNGEDPNQYISNALGISDNYIKTNNVVGHSTTRPVVKEGKIESRSIIYLFEEINIGSPASLGILVHELCHLKKMTPFTIENGEIHKSTGFQHEVYSKDGLLLRRTKTGLEESMNSFDEKEIMTRCLNFHDYDLFESGSGYALSESYLRSYLEYVETLLPGFYSEFNGSKVELFESIISRDVIEILNDFLREWDELPHIKDQSVQSLRIEELSNRFHTIMMQTYEGIISRPPY